MSHASIRQSFLAALIPLSSVVSLILPLRADAQECPSEYTACDNGGCCLSSEQCCPTKAEGCCSSSAPYCCGDGTCAATPSQCASTGRAACDGYDVPCGGGCAPAGSDCCDLAGHYCPPESMCTSETTCVFGNMPTLAREVAVALRPDELQGPRLSPPFRDPEDATQRSCSVQPPGAGEPARLSWLALAAALLVRRRTSRASRGSRLPGPQPG
jgi:MYXO-CTERM domain-containing protein